MTLDEIARLLCCVARGEMSAFDCLVLLHGEQGGGSMYNPLFLLFKTYYNAGCVNRLPEVAPAVYILVNGEPVPKDELERFDPKTVHLRED